MFSVSIDDPLLVVINLKVDNFLDVVVVSGQDLFDSGLMLKWVIPFKIDPFTHASPNFIVFSVFELFSDVEENLVAGSDGIVKIWKAADSGRLSFADQFVDFFGFHRFLNCCVILFVVCICALYVLD